MNNKTTHDRSPILQTCQTTQIYPARDHNVPLSLKDLCSVLSECILFQSCLMKIFRPYDSYGGVSTSLVLRSCWGLMKHTYLSVDYGNLALRSVSGPSPSLCQCFPGCFPTAMNFHHTVLHDAFVLEPAEETASFLKT